MGLKIDHISGKKVDLDTIMYDLENEGSFNQIYSNGKFEFVTDPIHSYTQEEFEKEYASKLKVADLTKDANILLITGAGLNAMYFINNLTGNIKIDFILAPRVDD